MFQSSSTAGCAVTIITAILVPQRSVVRSNRTGGGEEEGGEGEMSTMKDSRKEEQKCSPPNSKILFLLTMS